MTQAEKVRRSFSLSFLPEEDPLKYQPNASNRNKKKMRKVLQMYLLLQKLQSSKFSK